MTSSLRKILNRIRIAVLMVLVVLNALSALLIALAIDSIPLEAWPVWITFILNLLFLMLMGYANGWMYGTDLWWEREMRERGYTCPDCVHKNRCMDRSRNYCCTSFLPKEKERRHEDHENQRDTDDMGSDQRSNRVRNIGTGRQDQYRGL